jgi:transcriptional enhancer factor
MYWSNDRECPEETASTGSSTPPTPSADRFYAPISGNAWPSLQSQTTKDVLQSVLKVRKSWKTLRGGETVWPLDLEAALLEGKPMGSFSVQHRH